MKKPSKYLIITFIWMVIGPSGPLRAQLSNTYNYHVVIPSGGEQGKLSLEFYRGILRIIAGSPGATTLEIKSAVLNYDRYRKAINPEDSLQRYKVNRMPELEIETDNSTVRISNASHRDIIYIEVVVPPSFSIQAVTRHFGRFEIEGIKGNLDLNNFSGNILLRDVTGTLSAQTIRNGSISAWFTKNVPQKPAVITTYRGDITLSLPAESSIDLRLRTELGQVESDFSHKERIGVGGDRLIPSPEQLPQTPAFWVESKINDGGPLFLLQTIRGNIILKKVD